MIRKLEPRFVPRVWGAKSLQPFFPDQDVPTGEVWFRASDDHPLLVKFIFTLEKLSVQVHPGDEFAAKHENSPGKTEMWHILATEPGAKIAVGFTRPFSRAQVEQSIAEESIEEMLNWLPVQPGDTIYIPAGVVHAIGGGITLCEIQQNSDVTYRLYDYGRGRDLHIEAGLAVALLGPHDGRRPWPVSCEHFITDEIGSDDPFESQTGCEHLLAALSGEGCIEGEPFAAGEVFTVAHTGARITPNGRVRLLRTRCPA